MSQNGTLNEFNYTMREVAEKLNEESFQNKEWNERNVKEQFKGILSELKFKKEDIANFKSKRSEDGKYIFKR